MSRVYLDHAASSPVLPLVEEAMAPLWPSPGNPHSLHASGRSARRSLEEARESLAADLGCTAAEVVFTSGGTEANNLAILGSRDPSRPVAISAVEHPSVTRIGTFDAGAGVRTLPVDADGVVDLAAAAGLVPGCGLVSVMWVNNETGVMQPVRQVADLARDFGAVVHSDAAQAVGHVPVDVAAAGLDLMTVSAHKLGGPVGVGALVVRRGVPLRPFGFGGGQEGGRRSGTVPVALAVGFAAAVHHACSRLVDEAPRLARLRRRLAESLVDLIPESRVNEAEAVSPAILSLTVPGTRADDVLLILDAAGIDCSTGSACHAGVHQPSDTLLAMGRSRADASATLRFSFGPGTAEADIEAVITAMPDAVARARVAYA